MFMIQKVVYEETTAESLARMKVNDYEEESQCHYNNIVMMFNRKDKDLLLCQAMVYARDDHSFFYPHSFLIRPFDGVYLDFSRGLKDYLCCSLVKLVAQYQFKRLFFYDRKRVLYWMNRRHWFAPFDTDLDLLNRSFLNNDKNEAVMKILDRLERAPFDTTLEELASKLPEDKIRRWLPEEEQHLYQNNAEHFECLAI